jgi:hypothetical protein
MRSWLLAIILSISAFTQQTNSSQVETKEEPSNAILMDDGFEYRLIDYGLGKVQLRPRETTGQTFSDEVFWMEFRITNKSEHLIRAPKYFPSVSFSVNVEDNWGNRYSGRTLQFTEIGGSWHGVTLPVPQGPSSSYKPGEATNAFRIIPPKDFVQDLTELHIYVAKNLRLPPKYQAESHYFRVRNALQRNEDLLYSQDEPTSAAPNVSTVSEFVRTTERKKKH